MLAAATIGGCTKKEPASSQTSTTADNNAAAPPDASAANSSQPAVQAAPVDTSKVFTEADAALKAKDYQKATETLLALQQRQLTEQQAQAVRGQMVQLQGALASAVANGDPNAKAAAERLRASSMR